MQSDEQILAKTSALLNILQEKCWDGYEQVGLKKKGDRMVPNCVPVNEKVLREVTEDEMRVLEDVLDDLDTAKLPLNDLFSGKMRVVIPFRQQIRVLTLESSQISLKHRNMTYNGTRESFRLRER